MVKLVDVLGQDIFLILQIPNVVRVALAVLVEVVNLFIEVEKLAILVHLLALQLAELAVLPDLLVEGDATVINSLVNALVDGVDILDLLLKVVCHPIILIASMLKSRSELVKAISPQSLRFQLIFTPFSVVKPGSSGLHILAEVH